MFFIFLAGLVSWVCNIFIFILFIRSVLSWIVYSGNRYDPRIRSLQKVFMFLSGITEPVVAPVRRLISRFVRTGPFDFAPVATIVLLIIVRSILVRIFISIATAIIY